MAAFSKETEERMRDFFESLNEKDRRRYAGLEACKRRLEEIWMASPGETNRAQWAKFLSPAKHEGDVFSVGSGPALRFLPGDESRLEVIVLQVASLEKARRALSQSNLLGQSATDRIELNPAKTFGLRIILNEGRR